MIKIFKQGFTLVELLIVIAIIGLLSGLLITNFVGARSRARDAKYKSEMDSIKKALYLYQVQYGGFPGTSNNLTFNGCGPSGTSPCPYCSSADFAAGGVDGCQNVYMQRISHTGSFFFFRYYQCGGGSDYRLKVALENASDANLEESQLKCPASSCGLTYGDTDYIVCP